MPTSDSEEFESADESVEVNSSGVLRGKKGHSKSSNAPKADPKKTSSKKVSSPDVKETESAKGSSRTAPKKLGQSESVEKVASSIDEEKVFDMFDDKTSQRPPVSDEVNKSSDRKSVREPRPSNIGKKLGSKLGSSVAVKESSDKPKADSKKVDKTASNPEKTDKKCEELSKSAAESVIEAKSSKSASKNKVEAKSNDQTHAEDGWELEDGFEVPVSSNAKPKHQEFEKELFPVLNKLSSLTTTSKSDPTSEDKSSTTGGEGGAGGTSWSSGWGGWGVSSILSTATESVTTLTSHVSAGLNTVLETGLGAPDPQVLAQTLDKEKQEKENESKGNEDKPSTNENDNAESVTSESTIGFGGIGQLMSGVSQLGTKVLTGGLDTLETLGKKTMEVLQDGDPGLRKKRALFFQDGGDKPVLSQILREAKETAEKSDKMEEEKQAAKRVHLESLFDDYQGLVHLEALEMLSNQCQLKLQSILLGMTGNELKDLQETLEQVKELCELPDEEEDDDKDDDVHFKDKLTEAIGQLCKDVPHSKIFEVSQRIGDWLKSDEAKTSSPVVVHEKAVASMAEFTSVSMEIFHRAAELLLIKPSHSTATEAECLTQITTLLCIHVSRMATNFTMLLTENSDSKENNKIITTIFMESSQCSSYIQDACRLVVPVLQVGAAN